MELLLLMLLIFAGQSSGNTEYGEAGNNINSFCSEAQYFVALAQEIAAREKQRARKLDQIANTGTAWQIAAAAGTETDKQAHYTALADYAAAIYMQEKKKHEEAAAAAEKFKNAALRWAGIVSALGAPSLQVFTLADTPPSQTKDHEATASLTQKTAASAPCANIKADGKAAGNKKIDLEKINTLRVSEASVLTTPVKTVTVKLQGCAAGGGSCNKGSGQVFAEGPNGEGYFSLHGSANSKTLRIPTTTFQPATYTQPQGVTTGKTTNQPNDCANNDNEEEKIVPTHTILARYLCTARNKIAAVIPSMDDLSGTKLASDTTLKTIANNILQPNGVPQDLTHGDADAKLQTVIKNIYKEDSNSFKNNFVQPVVELTVATRPGAADKGSVQTMAANNSRRKCS
uniref:Variant surface glycoprotein 1448 n=1 Tax=Trypanosoma brucei TaxID=5691 RepID=M4SVF3_9TRYP|nr:variant surface glycoprotein 1448 [Trypanosoma brucei]